MSDEEKKAINHLTEKMKYHKDNPLGTYVWLTLDEHYVRTILNLIEKQQKEIEELKEDKYGLEEEVQIQAKNLMLCEDAIKETYTKWIDKIKAKTIEIKNRPVKDEFITASQGKLNTIIDMESLLEKET